MKILADASIPGLNEAFSSAFEISTYQSKKELSLKLKNQDILFCRSTLKVNEELLKNSNLKFVATASSGVDHINMDYLDSQNIQLISAKGSNAKAVADYVVSSLAFLQLYKGFNGSKALVIGVGEVGKRVVKRLLAIGFEVSCFDPLQQTLNKNFYIESLQNLEDFDLIALHPNLHKNLPNPSVNLFNEILINQLKPHTAIINASRGGIVEEKAIINAKVPLFYCTDVFENEPKIAKEIVDFSCLCTPHIAGHSIEAKLRATLMVAKQLHKHLQINPPAIIKSTENLPTLPDKLSWQELALRLYNPMHESALLKGSDEEIDKAFLHARKAHQYRHDFASFDASAIDDGTKSILGIKKQALNEDK